MKRLIGKDIGRYSFNAALKTVTFFDVSLTHEQILTITNATRNIMIYCFADAVIGGELDKNKLTLYYNTAAAMSNTDSLQIYVDIPDTTDNSKYYSLMEKIWYQLALANQLTMQVNNINPPKGWKEIK